MTQPLTPITWDITKYLHAISPWTLARMADCAGPDAEDSPGAQYLTRVRDAIAYQITYDNPTDYDEFMNVLTGIHDRLNEYTDLTTFTPYTHAQWLTFVDLAAYNEDLTDLPITADNLAQTAVTMIGERLAASLLATVTTTTER